MVLEEERTGTWHAYGKTTASLADSQFDANALHMRKVALLKPIQASENSRFADYLAVYFPEVAATLEEGDFGVLHLEVGALTLATRDAIARRDWHAVSRHFSFVDSVLESADTALHDAIGVSYLVNLFYGETSLNYAKARTLLPRRLALALEIMERHYEELGR